MNSWYSNADICLNSCVNIQMISYYFKHTISICILFFKYSAFRWWYRKLCNCLMCNCCLSTSSISTFNRMESYNMVVIIIGKLHTNFKLLITIYKIPIIVFSIIWSYLNTVFLQTFTWNMLELKVGLSKATIYLSTFKYRLFCFRVDKFFYICIEYVHKIVERMI